MLELDAAPLDPFKLIVDNGNGGAALGAGCFLINEECFCDMFKEITGHPYKDVIKERGTANFPTKTCGLDMKWLEEYDKKEIMFISILFLYLLI